jgi:hypothetical protein
MFQIEQISAVFAVKNCDVVLQQWRSSAKKAKADQRAQV